MGLNSLPQQSGSHWKPCTVYLGSCSHITWKQTPSKLQFYTTYIWNLEVNLAHDILWPKMSAILNRTDVNRNDVHLFNRNIAGGYLYPWCTPSLSIIYVQCANCCIKCYLEIDNRSCGTKHLLPKGLWYWKISFASEQFLNRNTAGGHLVPCCTLSSLFIQPVFLVLVLCISHEPLYLSRALSISHMIDLGM